YTLATRNSLTASLLKWERDAK
ncbi:unnamed protein product, partial [Allacma fusca]